MALDAGDEWEAKQQANALKTKKKKATSAANATKDTLGIGHPSYWDVRYKDECEQFVGPVESFDWYCPFEYVWDMIETFLDIKVHHKILLIGLGRSNAIDHLYRKKGFHDITAIDISPTIIDKMQKKYLDCTGVNFVCTDVCEMLNMASDSYSLVIDKAAIDSLFCSSAFITVVHRALSEIFRVLKPEGIFFCISHANPLARVPYFRKVPWAIDIGKLTEGESLSLFTLLKTSDRALLDKKIVGAEAVVQVRSSMLVSSLDQKMNKSSTTRSRANAGALTVTASLDKMIEMVDESQEVDGDAELEEKKDAGEEGVEGQAGRKEAKA